MSSLRGLLLWWLCGSGIVLVLVYTVLLEYYFRFGISLRIKASFEHNAIIFSEQLEVDDNALLPTGPGLRGYRTIGDIPVELLRMFPARTFQHGEMQFFFRDEDDEISVSQLNVICGGFPCELIFFYSYRLNDTEWLYMSQGIYSTQQTNDDRVLRENIVIFILLTTVLLFAVLALLLIKRIGRPVQQLATWADALTLNQLDDNRPDFQYRELNLVANHLSSAFERIAQSLEKERRFLQHASHELRTPIAVASGNLELLEKLVDTSERSDDESQAYNRLKYAVSDMQQLTETLLWLNRDTEPLPSEDSVDLNALIDRLIESNKYLLEYKAVRVEVNGASVKIDASQTLCRIVLGNLIRNAFQYTQDGEVWVTLTECSITITNKNSEVAFGDAPESDSDYGFGLGLGLVEQITSRLGWLYQYESNNSGRSSTIFFKISE